jgi:hypothetical protein
MSTRTQSPAKTDFSIHPATLIGHVSLSVANLENQVLFLARVVRIYYCSLKNQT